MKKKIAHIVPGMAVGGVEIGIERSCAALRDQFDYRVFYVRRKGSLDCDQASVVRLFWMLCTGKWRPDVVITSLWWAHLAGFIFKLLNIKWVAFFHSSRFPHGVARLFCKTAWKEAHYRLVDSGATDNAMQKFGKQKSSVVPYVFLDEFPKNKWKERPVDFIWAGRVSQVKRLDILQDFLVLLEAVLPTARIMLILAGEVPTSLKQFLLNTKLDISVKNNLANFQVRACLAQTKFYLLFSDYEGMSMATVEAVQAGCIAVVRPVGEIPTYLNADSCVWVNDIEKENLNRVLHMCVDVACDEACAERIRKNAYASISHIETYTEAMSEFLRGVE